MTSPSQPTFAIVGGGLAAAEAAKTLRAEGFEGRLVIVADELHLPYERPALSKEFLRGEAGQEKLFAQRPEFYEQERIELLTGTRAVGLDPRGRSLTLDDGHIVRFDRLLLATGARAIRPDGGTQQEPWVHVVRTMQDAVRLRESARGASSAVVAGGGWIAAEIAASLSQMGLSVSLVVPGSEILERHLGRAVGARLGQLHERHGVRVVRRSRVATTFEDRAGHGVRLEDGSTVVGDIVVLGFGATPATELADGAGLEVAGGVLVDEHLMTQAEGIFAAGDVAAAWHPRFGRHLRLEHWDNARRQGRTAARNLLGRAETFDRLPYFFSDQFELGLESIGLHDEDDDVIVRDEKDGFVVLWLRAGRVTAGMHANLWDAKAPIERLVAARATIDPAAFADPSLPLTSLVPSDAEAATVVSTVSVA